MGRRTKQDELELALKEMGAKNVTPLPRVDVPPVRRKKRKRRAEAHATRQVPRMWPWVILGATVLVIALVGIGYYPLQTIAACAVIALFGGFAIHRAPR